MRVSINILERNKNAETTCKAMAVGIAGCGDEVVYRTERDRNMDGFNCAVLWGYVTPCQDIVRACRAKKIPFVFIDMGYWQREKGYYKVCVNERHPDTYLMKTALPPDRFNALGIGGVRPWRKSNDGHILLAGMSGKAAWSFGLQNEQFEKEAVRELRRYTKRHILYRPKPSWREARPIEGAEMSYKGTIDEVLARTFCVVTHHSNVGANAFIAGVPVLAKRGASSLLQPFDLSKIETPYYPEGREQWAYNLAYCQWNLEEMARGKAWDYFKQARMV